MRPHSSLGGMVPAEFTNRSRHGRGDGNPAPTHLGDRSDELVVDVEGDLAGILTAASGNKALAKTQETPPKAGLGKRRLSWLRGQDLNL